MAKFFHCKECGHVIGLITGEGGEYTCNGNQMVELVADTVDAAKEKHVPEVKREGNKVVVQVGAVIHPMLDNHYITFIAVEQGARLQIANLKPGEEPVAEFVVEDGPIKVYEFCNLHGLWMAEA
ncbi:MAG: desulfoferrodoxin Dfx [Tissierellia bacterium]|nr:desulfoferrodoxin Dfx [Tissierellia bacterium]